MTATTWNEPGRATAAAASERALALAEVSALQASCEGRVLVGADAAAVAVLANRWSAGVAPVSVVLARCAHDVGMAVRFGARVGLGVVVLGPGARRHRIGTSADGLAVAADGLAVVVDGLDAIDVQIGASTWTARVGAAARWAELRDSLDAAGVDTSTLPRHAEPIGSLPVDDDGLVSSVQVVDASGRTRWMYHRLRSTRFDDGSPSPADDVVVTAVELRSATDPTGPH